MAAAPSLPSSISKLPSITPQRFLFSQPQFIKKPELGGSFTPKKSQKLRNFSSRRRNKGIVRASLGGLIGGLFKGTDTGEGTRKKYSETVKLINGMESEISNLSDSELRERTTVLKERAQNNESLESLLPEAFAVVREASKRVLGLRPFDVQLIGTCFSLSVIHFAN